MRDSFSFVGVSLFFAAVHQFVSFWELEGEGVVGMVCEREEGGGGSDLADSIIARTRSSTSFRCCASLVKIASASRRLRSRSGSASASSSASVGIIGDFGGAIPPTKLFMRWTKLAARCDTDDDGDGDRCHFAGSSFSSSSESSSEALGSIPVLVSITKPFLRGEGGRGDGLRPPSSYKQKKKGLVAVLCRKGIERTKVRASTGDVILRR